MMLMTSQSSVKSRLKFQPNKPLLVLGLLLLPLLLSLGFWQLERGEEKQQLREQFVELRKRAPIDILEVQWDKGRDALQYSNVRFTGYFNVKQYWLLDNQLYLGRPGYHIIAPVNTMDDHWVLVNLGWIQAPPRREYLPQVDLPSGVQEFSGHLYSQDALPFVSAESEQQTWPRRVPTLDIDRLGEEFGQPFLPMRVRIDADNPNTQVAYWPINNLGPERHWGYAVQWFLMAATLLILLLFTNSNLGQVIGIRNQSDESN